MPRYIQALFFLRCQNNQIFFSFQTQIEARLFTLNLAGNAPLVVYVTVMIIMLYTGNKYEQQTIQRYVI